MQDQTTLVTFSVHCSINRVYNCLLTTSSNTNLKFIIAYFQAAELHTTHTAK